MQDELVRECLKELSTSLKGMHTAGILADSMPHARSVILADALTQNFNSILSDALRGQYLLILKELVKFSETVFDTGRPWHRELLFVQDDLQFNQVNQIVMSDLF